MERFLFFPPLPSLMFCFHLECFCFNLLFAPQGGQLHQRPVGAELPGHRHLPEGGVLHQGRLANRRLPRGLPSELYCTSFPRLLLALFRLML